MGDFNRRKEVYERGAVLVEFHTGRTGTPHPPDLTSLRWEHRFRTTLPRVGEGVTLPGGGRVVVTNIIHILGIGLDQHYVVMDVEEDI